MPIATIARLSPTSTTSIPAASATCALGKSCAVITVIGSPFLCIPLSVPMVTLRRGVVGGLPMGEWELHLVWACGGRRWGTVVLAERKVVRARWEGVLVVVVMSLHREAHDLLARVVNFMARSGT